MVVGTCSKVRANIEQPTWKNRGHDQTGALELKEQPAEENVQRMHESPCFH